MEHSGNRLILTKDEMTAFQHMLEHPDPILLRNRNKFFREVDAMGIIDCPDGSFCIEFEPKLK